MVHKKVISVGVSVGLLAISSGSSLTLSSTAEAASRPFTIVANNPYGSTWSYNFYSPAFLNEVENFTLLPLAIQSPSGLSTFVPQLATSWDLGHGTLTVNLRTKVAWQTGGDVSSTDVVDSTILDGVASTGLWQDVTSVSAPSAGQVIYHLASGVNPVTAEEEILTNTYVLPSSQYGTYVTPGLQALIESYYNMARANPTAAAKSAAATTISADFTNLVKYSPASVDADGPYVLSNVTTFEAEFNKNPSFWGASAIHVPEILYQQTSTSNVEGEMLGGEGDYSWTGFSNSAYAEEQSRGISIHLPPNYRSYAIYFNDHTYPLNITAVRQALAYVLHRSNILSYMVGGYGGSFAQYPTLLDNAIENVYITPAQLHTLNPYRYNPAKAAALLESVGFHKKGSEWYEPNGKQFKLSFGVPAGWALEGFGGTMAAWLTSFGISTAGDSVEQPGFWTYEQEGNFQLEWSWGGTGINPLVELQDVLGRTLNFTNSGNYKGDKGIGFGPMENVPGLGKTNVPDAIDAEALTVGPGAHMDQLVWDWARLVNQQLPVLSFGNKNIPIQVSTKVYGDWPPESSPLWALQGLSTNAGLSMTLQDGYIRPV